MSPSSAEPRVVVSPDGSLVAHVEPDRIALLDGARLQAYGEIGIDPDAEGCDVALCGDPLRLVVLSRYATNSRVHLIDPKGPSEVGELPMRAGMRLVASSGNHVWLGGPAGSTLVNVVVRDPVLTPLALRSPVSAVGSFGDGRFVASTGGLIEEWDAEKRAPARRFRLAKPLAARFVGGGARQVWMVPPEGDRVEVIPLVNTGQPTRIELPEPPARIAADSTGELLAMIGASSGLVYVVDLSGKTPTGALEGVAASDLAWHGTSQALIVVDVGIEIVPVAGRPRAAMVPASGDDDDDAAVGPGGGSSGGGGGGMATGGGNGGGGAVARTGGGGGGGGGAGGGGGVPARIGGERAQLLTRPTALTPAARPAARPAATPELESEPAPRGWRDDVAWWASQVLAGTKADLPAIEEGPAIAIAARLGLEGDLAEALWLVYGAHLGGNDGVSAMDLVQVIGRRWGEVLGRGRLASSGALRWRKSRIRLRPEVIAALDESPPRAGSLIDGGGTPPDTAVAVIAAPNTDLVALATNLAPRFGPLLVGDPRAPAPTARLLLEARVRAALPILRWPAPDRPAAPAPRALLVVADDATARATGAALLR